MSEIKITLYGPNDEAGETFTRRTIPWGFLKRALRLSEQIEAGKEPAEPEKNDFFSRFGRWIHRNDRKLSSEEQMIDVISEFVVDVFNNQFTVKELEDGAEISEIMTVLQAIVSRAKVMVPSNPPPRPKRRK